MTAKKLTFAGQMLALQVVVVLAVVAIATITHGVLATQEKRDDARTTALTIARTVSLVPDIRTDVSDIDAAGDATNRQDLASGRIQQLAADVGERTGALFVVVTDSRGIRLAHPNARQLGERVSTDPSEALAGRETTGWQRGTLGESARAKVPVLSPDGSHVVGEVSVGFAAAGVLDNIRREIVSAVLVALAALAIGIAASVVLARRLRRLTLGLQPSELSVLVQDQTAVLGGIREGVMGVSPGGRVTVCNDRAATLLKLVDPVGQTLSTLDLPEELLSAINDSLPAANGSTPAPSQQLRLVFGERLLFIDVGRAGRDGTDLGTVVVLRDETDLESMSRRLTAVSAMSTALRVQRHEFANRLHVISGLMATSQIDEARRYLHGLVGHGPVSYPLDNRDLLREPYLQAFLGAKAVEAHERGVLLRLGDGTYVRGSLRAPEEATTVLGNLVDNAIAAAVSGPMPRWVEVEVLDDGSDLHLSVADSGGGIPRNPGATAQADSDRLWAASSRRESDRASDPATVRGLGFGLPLSRDLARRHGGDVWVADPGGDGSGAVFCARLPGVIEAPGSSLPAKSNSDASHPGAMTKEI
ncbi:MAG: histidine kinase [Glaciihabitans sp.]|nr:histidine kinase [Glaciihabitans sp.]